MGSSVNVSTLHWSTNDEGQMVSSQSKMMTVGGNGGCGDDIGVSVCGGARISELEAAIEVRWLVGVAQRMA